MATAEAIRGARASNWALSGLILLAMGFALGGLNSVVAGLDWWSAAMAVAALVLGTAAVVRSFARHRLWSSVAGVIASVMTMTFVFAPMSAILGAIPTPETFTAFRVLELAGTASIADQRAPAQADQGILFLLCLGVAGIAVAIDFIAFTLRARALIGGPLLVLLLVPSLVDRSFGDPVFVVLTAAVYLAILLVGSLRQARPAAVAVAVSALVACLLVPLALPTVQAGSPGGGSARGITMGLNPILTLGADLRRGDPSLALTYTSTEPGGQYLRLTALDDFSGRSWEPTEADPIPENTVSRIGPPPGLTSAVPTTTVTTEVTVANIQSRWLPAPYAPSRVTGLKGSWSWEPDALSIRTTVSNARNQDFEVTSVRIAPSIDQLQAAGVAVEPGMERYLDVPLGLPPVVAQTALEVVGTAATNYEKAIALQDYFRGGAFTYSEQAPVDGGYDGSGASVLADFLRVKSGYCVHFSSAMASMARVLGIPARVAVGFTPGQASPSESPSPGSEGESVEYRVTTDNFHAWPELYFVGIGWVRFEPTPGRGTVPEFAPRAVDDPATPDVDESVPPKAPTTAPTTAPSLPPQAQDPTVDESADGGTPRAATPPWALVLILLLFIPWAIRAVRRTGRLRQVSHGSALAAWDELRDTADDLGLATTDTSTPRQLVVILTPHLDDRGAAALARLRTALEIEAYAEAPAEPLTHDVRAVLRGMRRSSSFGRRALATLMPPSLFARWIPAGSSAH